MKQLFFLFAFIATFSISSFAQEGHYRHGQGSSHKGGKYKNSSTHDHYRTRRSRR